MPTCHHHGRRPSCPAPVREQESAVIAALAKVTTCQLEGNQLTLRDDDGATQVTYTQATD